MANAAHPTMTKTKVKDLIWKQNQDTNILGNIIRNKQMPMCKLSLVKTRNFHSKFHPFSSPFVPNSTAISQI